MRGWEDGLPTVAMVSLQCVYAAINLLNRDSFVEGSSRTVFVFYRLAIATLATSPIAYFTRDRSIRSPIQVRSFLLMFITAFIGLALCQNLYNEGLYLASSSTASAMMNLIPAITFLMATILRLEQFNIKRFSSIAKILGTTLCVGGAACLALVKGPKLLNHKLPSLNYSLVLDLDKSLKVDQSWLLGCLFVFGASCCWSTWLILQVPLTACCPNHISLSAWMCCLSMLQAGAIALFLERDPKAWILHSKLEYVTCFFTGIFGSGIQYFVQAWCISRKGPLFSAMFNPLSTVITTILGSILLHEQFYVGTLLGAIAVIVGLYAVLWGKAKEIQEKSKLEQGNILPSGTTRDKTSCDINLQQPLLKDTPNNEDFSN